MKLSKLVSPGLFKSGLRRFWPLWLALFIALVLSLDASIYSAAIEIAGRSDSWADLLYSMDSLWYSARIGSLLYAFAASIIVAAALDEYLFESRAATFVGTLPLKRQAIFATEFTLGYAALLGVLALAMVLMAPLRVVVGPLFSLKDMLLWYLLTAAVTFVLYAFAQLSCHLAGSRPVAVLLYGVINFLALCLEAALKMVIAALQYGMSSLDYLFDPLSPAVWLGETILRGVGANASVDWLSLGIYILVAIGVAVGTKALFVRRNLESAGESIAIPALRPVLKYLAGISMALMFSSILCLLRLSNVADGVPVGAYGALAVACVMAVGALLGVLFAEMIMSRSAHVFGRCWRDGLVLSCVALAFVGTCWFDVFGVAHRVPKPEDVKQVQMTWDYSGNATLTSQERIAEVTKLHEDLLAYDSWEDIDSGCITLSLMYQLNNGRTIVRRYPVAANYSAYRFDEEQPNAGSLLVDEFTRIADSEEGRVSRYAQVLDLEAKTRIEIEYYRYDEIGEYRTIKISPEDRADFIEHALRPDLLQEPVGRIAESFAVTGDDMLDASLYVYDESDGNPDSDVSLLSVILGETSTPHTLAWLHEHYPDLKLQRQDGQYVW